MKVSERIKELRQAVKAADTTAYDLSQLIQLEVETVEALQIARQGGYQAGYKEGLRMCNLPNRQ